MTLLVVTAVAAERDAILRALPDPVFAGVLGPMAIHRSGALVVLAGGVGPAAAAAAASAALAGADFDLVISAGIGGGFERMGVATIAVAATIAFADLGAETDPGFASVSALGFGTDRYDVAPQLAVELTDRTSGHLGTILTVATVTGTAASAHDLCRRFPDVVAEGMEGAGVAAAATLYGLPFAELRAISNAAGPRDRAAWRVPDALGALGRALAAITRAPLGFG